MPTNRTKRSRNQRALDHNHIDQLICGWPMLAGTGFSEGIQHGCNSWDEDDWQQAYRAEMRRGWGQHGRAFMAWWRGETEQFTFAGLPDPRDPLLTPWALTEFGEPQ